ncbi:hypothetical protein LUZ60_007070 [Juncus effusus]|nr:hypothetical protein LUZ60_007070 [Juncus effusus]
MVPVFSRSHARTSSLPCSSHPLIYHLDTEIRGLQSWLSNKDQNPDTPDSGLRHIDFLISTLEQVLNLPESGEVLHRHDSTEKFLDNLLCLADVFSSIRSISIILKQNHSELHSALRRQDTAWLAMSVKSQRQMEKDISQLIVMLKQVTGVVASDTQITTMIKEALSVSALASTEVLAEVIVICSNASNAVLTAVGSSRVSLFKKKCSEEEKEMAAMEKLEVMEECIVILERGSEQVFRDLVRARVSLLNIVSEIV